MRLDYKKIWERLSFNFPIYLYAVLAGVIVVYIFAVPVTDAEIWWHKMVLLVSHFISLVLIVMYWLRLIYVFKVRDGNPTIAFVLNRIVMGLAFMFVLRDSSLMYKEFIILVVLEMALSFVYLFDTEVYADYVEEYVE